MTMLDALALRRSVLCLIALVGCKADDTAGHGAKHLRAHAPVSPTAWHDWKLAQLRHPERNAPPPPPREWPSGEFDLAVELPASMGSAATIGTTHRVIDAVADPHAQWAIVCQQREDTNGDGKITYEQEEHFALGDDPSSYLVFGGGPGAEIDDVIATAPDGRNIVIEIDRSILLVHTAQRRARVLGPVVSDATTAASFSLDSKYLEYIERGGDGQRVIRLDLATGATTAVPLPIEAEAAIAAGGDGRWARVADSRHGLGRHRPRSYDCSLSGGLEHSGEVRSRWVDFTTGAVNADPTIVRPAGDHVFTRAEVSYDPTSKKPAPPIMLDGKPLGPTDCTEMDVLGIVESPPRALLECMRGRQDPTFTVTLVGDGLQAPPFKGSVDRNFDLVPVLVGEICPHHSQICFDVTTGATYARTTPEVRDLDYNPREYAIDDRQRRLTGTSSHDGPLAWRSPRSDDSGVNR